MNQTAEPTETHPLIRVTHEQREANQARQSGSHVDECFVCGRGLTESAVLNGWSIHMSTDAVLFANTVPSSHPDSQGGFPVGPECAKRIPRQFRFKAGA